MSSWTVTDTTKFEKELCRSNKPQHKHMYGYIVCDWTLNTPKIRIDHKNPRRRKSNSNLLIHSKNPRNRSNWFRVEWYCWNSLVCDVCNNQPSQALVTSTGPFGDCTWKFVYWHWMSGPPMRAKNRQFMIFEASSQYRSFSVDK